MTTVPRFWTVAPRRLVAGEKPARGDGGRACLLRCLMLTALAWPAPAASLAQGLPPDFVAPALVLNAQGHTDLVEDMIFSADGKYLVTGGRDKVVHVWEVGEQGLRLDRSIRPPIRRRGGRVHALALAPAVDAQGQRRVAVAGLGAIGSRGGILVYRLPGRTDREAGDLEFELPPDRASTPVSRRAGHAGAIFGLCFSPSGRYLASCSEDRTIRVWDLQTSPPKTAAVLQGHAGEVAAVSFLDDARIVSGGGAKDGSIRLWDWKASKLTAWVPCAPPDLAANEGAGVHVSALAVARDGRFVLVGRENGRLERYDGAGLRNGALLNPEHLGQLRPIEALAISPDGKTLAASVLKYSTSKEEYPQKVCDVSLRSMTDGRLVGPGRTIKGLVGALAFAPDGRSLAAAGGEAQQVALLKVGGALEDRVPPADGPGTTLWEAAFVDAKPTVAYSRARPAGAEAIPWEGFDLVERRFVPVAADAALGRAVRTVPGWKFTSRAFDRVALVPDQGAETPVQLSPLDGRWSSFTFLPANAEAGHPKLCAAIGCEEGGVLIYSLPDGLRTRVFLGHSGAVQGMAPSADGRWLLTCSADMTLALWSLNGCDARPALGAAITPDAQGQGGTVQKVLTRSFAERMGLKAGDKIEKITQFSRREPLPIARLDAELGSIAPSLDDQTSFQVRRPGVATALPMSTSRSDVPSLSLFPGGDREWVVWMPEGYYETSIAGDRRLLGWHLNHIDVRDPNRLLSLSSEFFPMSRYESQLRKPAILEEVLRTGNAVGALERAQGTPVVQKPPTIRVITPRPVAPGTEIAATQPDLDLSVEAEASPERRVRSLVVHGDMIRYPTHVVEPAAPTAKAVEKVRLRPDRNIITIEATDDLGVTSIERLEVRLDPRLIQSPVKASAPRLVIRSLGIEKFQERAIPEIRHAGRDAQVLADFFRRPDDRPHFNEDRIDLEVVSEQAAGAKQILAIFDELAEDARSNRLKAGDTVFIVLESHVLKPDADGSVVLSADSMLESDDEHAVPGAAIADRLEQVTKTGCLVMLMVDGIHGAIPNAGRSTIQEWIRDLYGNRGVLVLTASKQDPSIRLADLGAFAKAVTESLSIAGGQGAAGRTNPSTTLLDFEKAVLRRVAELTSRRQFAGFYPPETLAGWHKIRIFDPQSAPVNNLVER